MYKKNIYKKRVEVIIFIHTKQYFITCNIKLSRFFERKMPIKYIFYRAEIMELWKFMLGTLSLTYIYIYIVLYFLAIIFREICIYIFVLSMVEAFMDAS